MNLRLATRWGLLLSGLTVGWGALLWTKLPARMPIHFDLHGMPNGWASRTVGVLLLPGVVAASALFFRAMPKLSRRAFGTLAAQRSLGWLSLATSGCLALLQVEVLHAARTGSGLSTSLTGLALGAFIAVLGNQLGKIRPNRFVGVRTPWTLKDPTVWSKTHQLAGHLFVAAGLVTMVLALVSSSQVIWIAALVAASLIPIFYSFTLYRRLHPER